MFKKILLCILCLKFIVFSFNTNGKIIYQNGLDGYKGCTDTYLVMNSDKTQGEKEYITVEGYHCGGCVDQRALIRFDLSKFPKDAKLEKAVFSIYSVSQPRPGASTINIHTINKKWDETTANWFNANKSKKWSNEGGDLSSELKGSYDYGDKEEAWHNVEITSIIKKMLKDQQKNFGFALYMIPAMYTVRYLSSNSNDKKHRPKLTLTIDGTSIKENASDFYKSNFTITKDKNDFRVSLLKKGKYKIHITDLHGRLITNLVTSKKENKVNLSYSPMGIYIINIQGESINYSKKLIFN